VPACPRCGEDNPDRARFCLSCGGPLAEASGTREIRKTVTVLFTDVAGSTALGERLDPESLRRVMARYFEEMRSVLERHGGSVEKFIGDAVMAVFGVPVLHEDDALRAVRAAAEMRQSLERLNEELQRDWGERLEMRTGVNTGEVVTGRRAPGQSPVVGDAVNVAARLEQAAAPGEILIGRSTHRLVRDAVEAETTEPLALKGKAEPVSAYRLLNVAPGAPAYLRRMDSPMVGRRREFLLLQQAFERAAEDRTCHLFTILGSAGVGKSRLAGELASTCRLWATVLTGRCLPYGEGITYWPVAELIRGAAGLTEEHRPDDARRKVESLLAGEDDAPMVAEWIGQMLGLAEVTAEQEEMFWAVRRLLETLARDQALVLVLDDLHWAEPTLLDLVEHLADWARDAPLLVVCLARAELLDNRPSWGGGKLNATSIHLEPLTEEESATLVDNLLGRAQLAPDARRRITEAAEGNPLFVEEMLSMLIDDGLLRPEDGHWVPAGDLGDVSVPPTIQALLAARLDRLDDEERAVIERASVEGKVFHRGAVTQLSPEAAHVRVDGHLQTLVRKELVRPERSQFAGQDAFAFRHLLIRDEAYRAVSKESRAELHERFAGWLESILGARIAEYEEIAGYHLEQAHRYRSELGRADPETGELAHRAATRLGRAGRRAFDRGDIPAAVALLTRATALLPADDPVRLQRQVDLAAALAEQGEFAASRAVLERTVEAARRLGDRSAEWHGRMVEAELRVSLDPGERTLEELRREAEEAIGVFEESGDHGGLAKAWHLVALIHWDEARAADTEQALERAVTHAGLAGDRRQEAEDLALLSMTPSWGPTPVKEGIRRCEQILERAAGHPRVEAFALVTRGALEAMAGRIDQGRDMTERGRGRLESLGLLVTAAATSHASGQVELLAGDAVAAERALRAGYERLKAMGEKAYLSTTAAYLAEAVYQQGRLEEADTFTRISEETADPRDLASQIGWRSARAKILARQGQTEEAEGLATDALVLAQGTDFLDMQADALMALAEVLAGAGRRDEAGAAVEQALELHERKGSVIRTERARAFLAELRG
jgi:class 3 adenylate cyclase/tetratricopeptide (TPR) repeat protein